MICTSIRSSGSPSQSTVGPCSRSAAATIVPTARRSRSAPAEWRRCRRPGRPAPAPDPGAARPGTRCRTGRARPGRRPAAQRPAGEERVTPFAPGILTRCRPPERRSFVVDLIDAAGLAAGEVHPRGHALLLDPRERRGHPVVVAGLAPFLLLGQPFPPGLISTAGAGRRSRSSISKRSRTAWAVSVRVTRGDPSAHPAPPGADVLPPWTSRPGLNHRSGGPLRVTGRLNFCAGQWISIRNAGRPGSAARWIWGRASHGGDSGLSLIHI